ncbi:MAG: hypothetical protein J0J01_31385 [Reyranella sp.]|uniref:hypothetical protein n=1 Tax=Reyranella sp. TaxID=1929291 RepID=UPI001ACE910D|nr:hypothetical protein [Reyranella sp.]MBN9091445.1 hypothetical protein [Reyranella sp.]
MPEQDHESEDSVFDFLYVDHDRIGLYISQLNDFGSLTSLVRTSETSDKKDFKGKVPVLAEMGAESSARTSSTRSFDPRWTQCLTFLDELHARNMINPSVTGVGIGRFVLCGGNLAIIDIGAMQRLLKFSSVQTLARKGANPGAANEVLSRAQRKQQARSSGGKQTDAEDEMSAAFDIVGEISHAIHARVNVGNDHLWCTLKTDCMIMSPADVMLKYGVLIEGTWHVLGILDAVPSATEDQLAKLQAMFSGDAANPMLMGSVPLFTQLRLVLGRPLSCYGVTPLAIFRKIER